VGDTYETHVEGIRILPGQWRPHYPWEHIAWASPSWACQDYVWLDFPETLVTDQGLFYVSHLNPEIPPEEMKFEPMAAVAWREVEGGIAYERTLPNGLWFSGSVTKKSETEVALGIRVGNKGDETFTGVSLRTCMFLRAAREFSQHINANKFAHFRDAGWVSYELAPRMGLSLEYEGPDGGSSVADLPVTVCVSGLAQRLVAMTWFEDTFQFGGNMLRPCLHADPALPDLAPSSKAALYGEVIFFEGTLDDFRAYWKSKRS